MARQSDELDDAKRIMERLVRTPPKPHDAEPKRKPGVGNGGSGEKKFAAEIAGDLSALKEKADAAGLEMVAYLIEMALAEAMTQAVWRRL